jgi:hypothetical protein
MSADGVVLDRVRPSDTARAVPVVVIVLPLNALSNGPWRLRDAGVFPMAATLRKPAKDVGVPAVRDELSSSTNGKDAVLANVAPLEMAMTLWLVVIFEFVELRSGP